MQLKIFAVAAALAGSFGVSALAANAAALPGKSPAAQEQSGVQTVNWRRHRHCRGRFGNWRRDWRCRGAYGWRGGYDSGPSIYLRFGGRDRDGRRGGRDRDGDRDRGDRGDRGGDRMDRGDKGDRGGRGKRD